MEGKGVKIKGLGDDEEKKCVLDLKHHNNKMKYRLYKMELYFKGEKVCY